MNWRLFWFLVCGLLPLAAEAHVGSPNVFFDGNAGPYPVHVIIKPAEVIPGLAEIIVRVDARGVERVTALPIKWDAGRKGAPPPDVAEPVRGETNLYTAELWFMEGGAQSVEVEITGVRGTGRVTIPVDAIARRVLTMPKTLGAVLIALGLLLVMLLLSVIGAAIRESVLAPGTEIPRRRRSIARVAVVVSACILTFLLWGGKKWWDAEAADYRNNRLYRPLDCAAKVRVANGARRLQLEINDPIFDRSPPLVPDHGKLMHLFLMRLPGLDAFAHLHPLKQDRKWFETLLPDLPAGSYQLYADITYETGFSDTLATTVEIPDPVREHEAASPAVIDEDDSWRIASGFDSNALKESIEFSSRFGMNNKIPPPDCALDSDYSMSWVSPPKITANDPVTLRFQVLSQSEAPAVLEPYLGMRGHLALRRQDGAVFTHLHPGGSASMAAMQLAVLRTEGKLPLKAAFGMEDPICELPPAGPGENEWLQGRPPADSSTISFPYAFPKPGAYRLWVQVKVAGRVRTGVFDTLVGQE